MNALNRSAARAAIISTAVASLFASPFIARADDPFTNTLINLSAPVITTAGSTLAGPGTNNVGNTIRTQSVPVAGKPNVDVQVATVTTSASVFSTGANPGSDRLRVLALATATRTNNILPADTSTAIAAISASSNFSLPSSTGAGVNTVWYRKWDIRLDGTVTGQLTGATVGAAGAPLPAWDSQLIRDDGMARPTLLTLDQVSSVHYQDKIVTGGLNSNVDLNSTQGANGTFPINPFALVLRGGSGSVILTSVPDTYTVRAQVFASASAQSTTVGGFKGSSANTDIKTGPNEMDVDVKSFGVVAKNKPKAWMDPAMNFDGATVSMDPQPLSAVQLDDGQVARLDDSTPGDNILVPAFSDPNSVLVNVGSFSVLGSSGGVVSFSDAPFNITVNGATVLSGLIDDITADTDTSNPSFDGDIQITGLNNSINSQWLSEMGIDTTKFSFDPDLVAATNGFTSPVSGFQGVNLITVPEPASIGLLMSITFAACLKRRRRQEAQ